MQTILGQKQDQTQVFLTDGRRQPVTRIVVTDNTVTQVKTADKDAYWAVQIGFGSKKRAHKALAGHIKKAGTETVPALLREVRIEDADTETAPAVGAKIKLADVLKPGDIVQVSGVSKGKGFAGGVKRYGFRGGPRTHGQSDRERAPGSIGQTTTPGRVYKGKRMAGRMGHENVTVSNLTVLDIVDDTLFVKGLVPGGRKSVVMITKTGETKNFVPVFKPEEQNKTDEVQTTDDTVSTAPETVQTAEGNVADTTESVTEAQVQTPEEPVTETGSQSEAEASAAETNEETKAANEASSEAVTETKEEAADDAPAEEVKEEDVKEGAEDGSK